MGPLFASAGMRLSAVQGAHQTTDLLVYGTPVLLLVSLAAAHGGRKTIWRYSSRYKLGGLPVVGNPTLSALYMSWLLAQLAGQLHSFWRCQGIDCARHRCCYAMQLRPSCNGNHAHAQSPSRVKKVTPSCWRMAHRYRTTPSLVEYARVCRTRQRRDVGRATAASSAIRRELHGRQTCNCIQQQDLDHLSVRHGHLPGAGVPGAEVDVQ